MSGQETRFIYLKLGGSLITDKRRPETPRLDVIERLAHEIAEACRLHPGLQLIIGHGSGSYGHMAGQQYGTRSGVSTVEQWYGFAVTADAAARLNRIVTSALLAAAVPAWTIQPSVFLRCEDGKIVHGSPGTVNRALANGLVPVVHGDVALDSVRGGTIASTEEIFEWMAQTLRPSHLILLGEVDGIFSADPALDPSANVIPIITQDMLAEIAGGLGGSHGVDVTGGMVAKVAQALKLVGQHPGLEVIVANGLRPGLLQGLLIGQSESEGTRIRRHGG